MNKSDWMRDAIEEFRRMGEELERAFQNFKGTRKELTPAEFEARMAELERQKQEMMRQHLAPEGKR